MSSLVSRISQYLENRSDEQFPNLVIDLFAYQYSMNEPYRRLCDSVAVTPATLTDWKEIPAVPAQAFRMFELSCTPISKASAVFHSSGTTSDKSSRHWMDDEALRLYELSLSIGFRSQFPSKGRLWAVMPSPDQAPHSSLSHMLGALQAERFAGTELKEFGDALTEASSDRTPITLFGTAFGLMELLTIAPIALPYSSRVIETGGFKGRFTEISRSEFYGLLRDRFSLSDDDCYSEYGMCELASQFYSRGEDGFLNGPKWAATRCIDPLTGTDAEPGTVGLLRHYDLANLNSVAVIQTQDRGVMQNSGGFKLVGRATDAELRGCSLTAEELWSR